MLDSAVGQGYIFLGAVYSGFAIGLVYDIFGWLRRVFHAGMFLTALLDLIYCVIAFLIVMVTLLTISGGELRLYTMIGLACGIGLYGCLISPLLHMTGRAVFSTFYRINKKITKVPGLSRLLR